MRVSSCFVSRILKMFLLGIATLFVAGAAQAQTVVDFEDGSLDNWEAVDDVDSEEGPSDWQIRDSQLGLNGKALYQPWNINSFNGGLALMGTFIIYKAQQFTNFVIEVDVVAEDNDGMGLVWAYTGTDRHYRAFMSNDPVANKNSIDGLPGPFLKMAKRVSNNEPWYELLSAADNYVEYPKDQKLHWKLEVNNGFFTFTREDGLSITGEDHSYETGYVGIQLSGQRGIEFDNFTITALPDVTGPSLTAGPSASEITITSAVVTWSTDMESDSVVEYGDTPEYGLVAATGTANVTDHSVALSSLLPDTVYYYRVLSTDADDNTVSSGQKTFRTLAEAVDGQIIIDFEDDNLGDWEVIDDIEPQEGPSGWQIRDSQWGLDGKALYQPWNINSDTASKSLMGTFIIYKVQEFTNFILEVDVVAGDNDGMGLVWAYTGTNKHYRSFMNNDQNANKNSIDGLPGPFLKMAKRVSDDEPWHELLSAADNYVEYPEDQRLHWRLEVNNGSFTFTREDGLTITGQDQSYKTGYIGIQLSGQRGVEFDNISITPLPDDGGDELPPDGLKGDVNGDGRIRSNDAILTLRISAGMMTATEDQEWAADMNDDGRIRSNDAILILREAAGLNEPSASTTRFE